MLASYPAFILVCTPAHSTIGPGTDFHLTNQNGGNYMPSKLNIQLLLVPPTSFPISSLGRGTSLSPLSEGDLTFRQVMKRVCKFWKRKKKTQGQRKKHRVCRCFFFKPQNYHNGLVQRTWKTTRLRIPPRFWNRSTRKSQRNDKRSSEWGPPPENTKYDASPLLYNIHSCLGCHCILYFHYVNYD